MTPLERAEMFALKFRGQANHLAFQFGGPVYMVGSMLTAATPGDIDIRCVIAREDADLWFGADSDGTGIDWTAGSFARAREELKVSRRMTRRWSNRGWWPEATRIDFQFQISLFDDTGDPIHSHGDRPRLRLDRVPNDLLIAGRGDP